MAMNNFYTYGPEAGQAKNLVMMLHGVGSNGQDLISLAPYMSKSLPDVAFISPDAPFPCDMVPAGYPNSYQWFSLLNRDPNIMIEGVQSVFPFVENFIEAQLSAYGLKHENLVLLGFSQGTMTSLHVAPRLKFKIAGVLGYSGALIWMPQTNADDLQKIPIHLIHGEADNVVPVQARAAAVDALQQNGFVVSGHTTPGLAHSIDEKGIESGISFLQRTFS
ncbi:MAG: phospholipase [Alphaproteobacteria bacterium]|nr:phospholipase [Alphaproteobacteria bacterium]